MRFIEMREQLKDFYLHYIDDKADEFCVACENILNNNYNSNMSIYDMKLMQYEVITEEFEPQILSKVPFYYEMGTMISWCDGSRNFHGHTHPGGWVARKLENKYVEANPELHELASRQRSELFYLICGYYNDSTQHFAFNYRPVFEMGLKGVYEKAKAKMTQAVTEKEKEFLNAVCQGLLCVKRISEKFADKAEKMLKDCVNEEERKNLQRIAQSARRTPWEKPETFYEALNTLAFLRKALGALEGIGFNSFGRVDIDLYPFYVNDLKNGVSEQEIYHLICKFLIVFDLHYDHDKKMVYYSDHELENTYVLGGCDKNGNTVYNQLTKMFLLANEEEKIIYPKIKCRYSANSPKEYLDLINKSVANGTSTILYENDDSMIPALIRSGRTEEDARDYIVTGCWGVNCYGKEKTDGGNYVNLLKPFEYSIHNLTDKMEEVGMKFGLLEQAKTFEEVYQITLSNIKTLFEERIRITTLGGNMWDECDVLPLFSSTLDNCLENKKDFTSGGACYRDDVFMLFGFPNIVDSLLAIKQLVFDKKEYTLDQLLNAVRTNWESNEKMRIKAMRCNGWGDGSKESCQLASRFNADLFALIEGLKGSYGGKVLMGHLTYTEILWWGAKTKATPDGRKDGEYFAQGLTPSRLKSIPSSTDVICSFNSLDGSMMPANTVVNLILPSGTTLLACENFLRAAARSSIQAIQLNCVSKEQLLDAQKHPEKYPELIVRVTGFSAKFTSLSPTWQQEVITRNFYKN